MTLSVKHIKQPEKAGRTRNVITCLEEDDARGSRMVSILWFSITL